MPDRLQEHGVGSVRTGGRRTLPSLPRMAAPLVISFWMRAAFTLVDTIYAATIGDAAVASIGLTVPFEFLLIAVWVGLSTGLTSLLSSAMGAGQGRKIEQYLAACWRLVFGVSPVFVLVGAGIFVAAPLMNLEAEVARNFRIYGSVIMIGSALTAFWSVIPDSLVKAHQDTRTTMWAGIWSNVVNVGLNTLFLFVFGWGVFGIALSTVIGRLAGLAYALLRARQHEARRRGEQSQDVPGLDPTPYRSILGLAVPSSLTFTLMAAETALINFLLSRLPSPTEAIAAYSIYYRVLLFALNPMIALSVAMLPYSARRFGNDDVAGVRRGLAQAGWLSAAYSFLFAAPVMVLTAHPIAAALAESALTREFTATALLFVPLACLVSAPFLYCRPVFEGMQRGRPGLIIALLRYAVLTGPLAGAGLWLAGRLDHPRLPWLIGGTLVASALSSAVFYAWLRTTLAAMSGGAPKKEPAR